jgi:uncharacterized membrane protein
MSTSDAGTADASAARAPEQQARVIWAGLLLGIGLGGFFDGIVLHQMLQWHHMLSNVGAYPTDTVPGLRVNTLWDGIFHAVTYVATVTGLMLQWSAARMPHAPWSTKRLLGLLLMGWGGFNVVEAVIDHHLLAIHHVNETAPREQWLWWDLAFLAWGALMLVGGWMLFRADKQRQVDGRLDRHRLFRHPR